MTRQLNFAKIREILFITMTRPKQVPRNRFLRCTVRLFFQIADKVNECSLKQLYLLMQIFGSSRCLSICSAGKMHTKILIAGK